ncbi:Ribonuclease inhibitor [Labeo rohita]|uniref:Ribonuclease inhibitor n=1 Tax=Labeo rohita TaxID=84645 RepID=A0ABQ8LK38_LABRO|nr:Ribonuclease inhibitor [Labeo rohita]
MSNNNITDSGVKKLKKGLENTNCKLEKLRLSNCSITEEGYKALASALRSNPSHLIELDLTGNDPGQSGVKELNGLLQDPNCQLKTLRFLGPDADEACQYVIKHVGKNLLLIRELNLSERELGDTLVNQIAALLQDKHCKLHTLHLCGCSISEKQSFILTLALKLNSSHLRELDLTLKSNPSHLRELDLSGNKLGDSGFENLGDLLMKPQFKLEILALCECSVKGKQCVFLTSALKTNPSHLRELNLSMNELGDSGLKNLSDLLINPQFKLEKLDLCGCSITEEQCLTLTSALKSNPSHLRELDLSRNKLRDSGMKNLSDLLMNPQCKLKKLCLCGCSITEKQCLLLTPTLCLKILHLRELNLSRNKIRSEGVETLCDILNDSRCKLERLSLNDCGITDVAVLTQSLSEKNALKFLKELDLRNNMIGDSLKQLSEVMRDSNCKLKIDTETDSDQKWSNWWMVCTLV